MLDQILHQDASKLILIFVFGLFSFLFLHRYIDGLSFFFLEFLLELNREKVFLNSRRNFPVNKIEKV